MGWLPGKVATSDWRDESAGGDLNVFQLEILKNKESLMFSWIFEDLNNF